MRVEEIMKTEVYTLSPEDTIGTALQLLRHKKIRHIPITDSTDALVGLVSDRDVKDATPSILDKGSNEEELKQPLSLIMQRSVITGHPLDFVEEVAATLSEHQISCMPIIQDGHLVGIITETDLLNTFVELTGANQPGSRIEVKVPNRAGILFEILSIINKRHANIQSVLVYPDK
ncbi:MAG TPA: CBS and ACT domain-containing protein, partial [Chondromyces sp.]|nr:CBS and ACT domain-containing protein [Chondromyces sp.]